ncbi:unnamed protein product [Candida verbasci]|uniref:Gluconokinase n=1 Tax=Candida verbasci TaxID=1227364 RepID=A0A9W4X960_9ASCO|nr:unnamed protein product [Candida verbasci]
MSIAKKPTVIVVGGPAGTGKTTQGELLAKFLQCSFIEGDTLHPQSNIDKMASGQPLTDDDRWGWLKKLSEISSNAAINDSKQICVVSCSMLKKIYRTYIKNNSVDHDRLQFRFVFLYSDFNDLVKRVNNRQGHYMKSDMVKSQYDIMEIPKDDELLENGGEGLAIDTLDKTSDEIFKELIEELKL